MMPANGEREDEYKLLPVIGWLEIENGEHDYILLVYL